MRGGRRRWSPSPRNERRDRRADSRRTIGSARIPEIPGGSFSQSVRYFITSIVCARDPVHAARSMGRPDVWCSSWGESRLITLLCNLTSLAAAIIYLPLSICSGEATFTLTTLANRRTASPRPEKRPAIRLPRNNGLTIYRNVPSYVHASRYVYTFQLSARLQEFSARCVHTRFFCDNLPSEIVRPFFTRYRNNSLESGAGA